MRVLDLLNIGSNRLRLSNINSHSLDSEILLSKVLDKNKESLIVNFDKRLKCKEVSKFKDLIKRRYLNEPVAYILCEKEFWSKKFKLDKSTLIPRPETELMVEQLVKIYKSKRISILDIGTGSGCIIISLLSELNKSKGIAVDISAKCLLIAKKNALLHNVNDRIKFYKKSSNDFYDKKFDLIVSNPPYISTKDLRNLAEDIRKYEPLDALDGGKDGLDVIKKVIYKSKHTLKLNGKLALEIGKGQYKKVSNILIGNNFKIDQCIRDFKDNIRCIISTKINK